MLDASLVSINGTGDIVLLCISLSALVFALFLLVKMALTKPEWAEVNCPVCGTDMDENGSVWVDNSLWDNQGERAEDLVEEWHLRMVHEDGSLAAYMGLSDEEYALWAEYPPHDYETSYKCGECLRGSRLTYSRWCVKDGMPLLEEFETRPLDTTIKYPELSLVDPYTEPWRTDPNVSS